MSTVRRLHDVLLHLDGLVPDRLLPVCRELLAAGRTAELAGAVVQATLESSAALSDADRDALAEALAGVADPVNVRAELDGIDAGLVPAYRFAAGRISVDVSGGPIAFDSDSEQMDDLDATAVVALREIAADLVGLWGTWRSTDPPLGPPRRIYLVETVPDLADGALVAIAPRIQAALSATGEASPQVAVLPGGSPPDAYHRAALGNAALLWAAAAPSTVELARVYDRVDSETGPTFDADHPRIPRNTVVHQRLLDYLDQGEPLVLTTTLLTDVVDPTLGEAVPINFRTDGRWIWPDAVAYYLNVHELAPDPELFAHARAADFLVPHVDGVRLHRAMAVLLGA